MATTTFTKKSFNLETGDPAVTPPPADSQTSFVKKPKLVSSLSRKRDIPVGLWTKCKKCGAMIYDKELDANLKVCPKCDHHFPISARERIHALVETCSFEEYDPALESVDILKFTGVAAYTSKLDQYKKPPTSRTPFARALAAWANTASRWG
jgi:acetyl-CoA carboxylase carboxyl transferase subunit beta